MVWPEPEAEVAAEISHPGKSALHWLGLHADSRPGDLATLSTGPVTPGTCQGLSPLPPACQVLTQVPTPSPTQVSLGRACAGSSSPSLLHAWPEPWLQNPLPLSV